MLPVASTSLLIIVLSCAGLARGARTQVEPSSPVCSDSAARLVGESLLHGRAFERLTHLCDRIGPRLAGSKALDDAVHWAADVMKQDGFENVRLEKVMVPHWVRGHTRAALIEPREQALDVLALGGSPGTPEGGITAEVMVVKSFEELTERAAEAAGKFVLFNDPMVPQDEMFRAYGPAVRYRSRGASEASKRRAVGALVRSVTTVSLNTPHTGATGFDAGVRPIPAVAVTTETADLLERLVRSGQSVQLHLDLGCQTLPDVESANVVGEIVGRETPEEIVLLGAHIDSWDVGTGAHDDGAGTAVVLEAARLLRRLDLRAKRTIRVVLFTNEENGLRGARGYREQHVEELERHTAAFEVDSGGFRPKGFRITAAPQAVETLRGLCAVLEGIDAHRVDTGGGGADIGVLRDAGVPLISLWPDSTHYFDLHHTRADTLDKVNPRELRLQAACLASIAYAVADLDVALRDQRGS